MNRTPDAGPSCVGMGGRNPYEELARKRLAAEHGTPGYDERVRSLAGRLMAEDEAKGIVRFTGADWGMDY